MDDDTPHDGLSDRLEHLGTWTPTSGGDVGPILGRVTARRTRRRRVALGVAAVVALVGGLAWNSRDQSAEVVVADTTATTATTATGFASWGPGWHELDTGPVPAMSNASMAWTGEELLVVGDDRAFSFEPNERRWLDRGRVPLFVNAMEVIDGRVITVGSGDNSEQFWAELDLTTWQWSRPAPLPANPALEAVGVSDLGTSDQLIWNGNHLFAMGAMAAFDPTVRTWTPLALPDDLMNRSHLLYGQAAVINGSVELVSPSVHPGLRWNADGSEVSETTGIPGGFEANGSIGATTASPSLDGLVMADIDAGSDGPWRTFVFDGTYRAIAAPPEPPSRGCPQLASGAGRAVALPCSVEGAAHELVADRWRPIGAPLVEPTCCSATSDTGDALVAWSASTDTANDPANAPYVSAAVWVPSQLG